VLRPTIPALVATVLLALGSGSAPAMDQPIPGKKLVVKVDDLLDHDDDRGAYLRRLSDLRRHLPRRQVVRRRSRSLALPLPVT